MCSNCTWIPDRDCYSIADRGYGNHNSRGGKVSTAAYTFWCNDTMNNELESMFEVKPWKQSCHTDMAI